MRPYSSPALRLDDLDSAWVVARRTLPPPSASAVYELTDRGLELEAVLRAIGDWGVRSPMLPKSDTRGADTFVLGLRARDRHAAAEHMTARYELRIAEDVYAFHIDDGHLTVRRGACEEPKIPLTIDNHTLAAVARGDRSFASALAVSTDVAATDMSRFAELFDAPGFENPSEEAHGKRTARPLART